MRIFVLLGSLRLLLIVTFYFFMLLVLLFFTSAPASPLSTLWGVFSKFFVSSFRLSSGKPLSSYLAPHIFLFMLGLMISGILPYSYFYLGSLKLILFISYSFWLGTFLFNISSSRLSFLLFHREHGPFMASFLLPIEVVSLLVKPVALAVRMYANLIFGHYMLYFSFMLVSKIGPCFYFLIAPLFIFELGVFVVQSYIFTYLLVLYLSE